MFDREKSLLSEIPDDIRAQLLRIYRQYARASVTRRNGKWVEFDPIP